MITGPTAVAIDVSCSREDNVNTFLKCLQAYDIGVQYKQKETFFMDSSKKSVSLRKKRTSLMSNKNSRRSSMDFYGALEDLHW